MDPDYEMRNIKGICLLRLIVGTMVQMLSWKLLIQKNFMYDITLNQRNDAKRICIEIILYANVNGTLNYKNALVKMCPIISCFDEGSILFTIDTAFITAVQFLFSPMKYP